MNNISVNKTKRTINARVRFECTGKLRAEGFVPVSDGAHKYSITDRSLKVGSITLIRVEKL